MAGLISLLVAVVAAGFGFGSDPVAVGLASGHDDSIGLRTRSELSSAPVELLRTRDGHLARGLRNQANSKNWSGYIVTKFESAESYTSAQGTWTVPTVSHFVGFPAEYSAVWVGIGGYCKNINCTLTDRTLIQVGTAQNVAASGFTDYYAWYELLPGFQKPIPLEINPGDTVTASLECAANCSALRQSWTLSMVDQTTPGSWSQTFTYASRELSADWIVEAPALSGRILPLADFDTVVFGPDTANGSTPSLSFSANGLVMNDPRKQTSNPSDPTGDLTGFATCWDDGTALAPCSTPSG
jgi:hypothetical protein